MEGLEGLKYPFKLDGDLVTDINGVIIVAGEGTWEESKARAMRAYLTLMACSALTDKALALSVIDRMIAFIEAQAVAGNDPEAQSILDMIRPAPKDATQMSS